MLVRGLRQRIDISYEEGSYEIDLLLFEQRTSLMNMPGDDEAVKAIVISRLSGYHPQMHLLASCGCLPPL